MKHIAFMLIPHIAKVLAGGADRDTVCGVELSPVDDLTEVAMESDCDNCRTRLNIGATRDKGSDGKPYGVKTAPVFEPGEVWGKGREEDCVSLEDITRQQAKVRNFPFGPGDDES